jgi:hypothetical protein
MDALSVIEAMPDSVVAQGDKAVSGVPGPAPARAGDGAGLWMVADHQVCRRDHPGGGRRCRSGRENPQVEGVHQEGGQREGAAYLLIRVARGEEKISELGARLGGLAGSILGIDSIKKQCR